ncbi:carboxypeptidase-like regulatory domain-containing protein [bacterium]|nr:carboxypeptidase-like regulatory domain-containing protein [bacterium]
MDANTGQTLASANIQIENTYQGTITNEEGEFQIVLPFIPAFLNIRYIGYEPGRIRIDTGTELPLIAGLTPSVIRMQPIVVTDENPGMTIMREVIRRKAEWQNRLSTFSADSYIRFALSNDSGIVCISESTSRLYWKKTQGTREVILSGRHSDNIQDMPHIPVSSFFMNLYDDDIDVLGTRMMGPTHPDALDNYRFELAGTRAIGHQTIYDIRAVPKNRVVSCFQGTLAVLDSAYAMIEADLVTGDAVMLPRPARLEKLHIRQQFHNFGHRFWLPVDLHYQGNFQIEMPGFDMPGIRISQISRIHNYRPGSPVPDSLFREEASHVTDSAAGARAVLDAGDPVVIPLTQEEKTAYENLDSTKTLARAFQPGGLLGHIGRSSLRIGNQDYMLSTESDEPDTSLKNASGPKTSRMRDDGGLWVHFNRTDAWHLGLRYSAGMDSGLTGRTGLAWLTGPGRMAWETGLSWPIFGRKNLILETGIQSCSEICGPNPAIPPLLNSAAMLLGRDDYYDYYWKKSWNMRLNRHLKTWNAVLSAGLNIERHTSVDKETDFSLFRRSHKQQPNPDIDAGRMNTFIFGLNLGDRIDVLPVSGTNGFSLEIEHALPDLPGSDHAFTQIRGSMALRIPTFFRRRLLANTLDIKVTWSTSTGELPFQKMTALHAHLQPYSPFGTFKTLTSRNLKGEKSFACFWEHNFRTVPFEITGLGFLIRRNIGLIIYGASGRAWISGSRLDDPRLQEDTASKWHHEIGLSVNNIFTLFRVDLTKNLNTGHWFAGVGIARLF